MVRYALELSFEYEQIQELSPPKDDEAQWGVKACCQSCKEPFPSELIFSLGETQPISGSRGSAHLVVKCKQCRHEANLTLQEIQTVSITSSSSSSTCSFIAIADCRGMTLTSWRCLDPWTLSSEASTFTADLNDDWVDYDEKLKESVAVTNLSYTVKALK